MRLACLLAALAFATQAHGQLPEPGNRVDKAEKQETKPPALLQREVHPTR